MISIFILTKNEQQDLPGCLESISWCDDIHVFDSFSDDRTVEIARNAGATVTQRKFDNWSAHQNWAVQNLPFKYPWVLYLDADERVSEDLRGALLSGLNEKEDNVAYEIRRRDFAWNGVWLKHAQMSPFYLRFFRRDKMRYERIVHPISIADGPVGRLEGYLDHYPFSKGFFFWIQRHFGYANFEASVRIENLSKNVPFSWRKALFSKDFTEKRYHQKGLFYKMPGRPIIKWFYLVVWRRAFLDGGAGLTYATLQAIYEYFIVLRTKELISEIKKGKKRV